jgi:DNA-directed RNA polymerase specialized sigma24 family protein
MPESGRYADFRAKSLDLRPMTPDDPHLRQIATRWTLLLQAHGDNPAVRYAAQGELLPRYCAPVYRYLRALVQDDATADDLSQEFALRFLRGDFRHADASRGRFRDYLKSALCRLAKEYAGRVRARFQSLPDDVEPAINCASDFDSPEEDRRFLELWRAELLNRTWHALESASAAQGDRFYEVLRLKSQDPSRTSAALAKELTRRHAHAFTAEGVRQSLHRARERFAELLRAEVAASVPTSDSAEVDAELADLGLLVYCPPAA